jgi:ribonuclease P protein component
MTLFVLPNNLRFSRLGIAATRKLGGAVRRNRAKRLVREFFRRNKIAPGLDVVVVPRREALDVDYAALETDFRDILMRRLPAAYRGGLEKTQGRRLVRDLT